MKKNLEKVRWIFYNAKSIRIHLISVVCLGAMLSLISVYNALISKNIIDAATHGSMNNVIKWIIVLAIVICIQVIFSSLNTFLGTYCGTKLLNDIQKKLYTHITYGEWEEQAKYHSVNLITRMNSDVSTICNLVVSVIPSIISLSVMLLASFITLLKLAPTIAVIIILVSPLFLFISKLISRKLKSVYMEIQQQEIEYRTFMQESIQNTMIVKSFCKEQDNIKTLNKFQKIKLKLILKRSKITLLSSISLSFGAFLGYFIVFSLGAINLAKGIGTFGTLTALLQLFSYIQGPFSGLASQLPSVISALAATERLMDIEKINLESNGDGIGKDDKLEKLINLNKVRVLEEKAPNIKIENLYFNYKKHKNILENVSLNINSSEIVAFIGPSGQGKTTLIRLILSFIHVKNGSILLENNKKSSHLSREHRNLISYVPQGNTLFSGTIKENILYGNKYATEADIEEATKLSCAWDFINNLDKKLDTIIGEKGLGISEGQAQRIALARALIRKKPILILDEATSALDGKTEVKVLKAIKNLKHKPTCIIITHRESALNICNRIFKLENKTLVEINKDMIEVG
ncbi:ABC transporter ATP-binding protein [Clostridium tarantellae]|uniref:ATP-binding cassette domain-containing protein n=1 Tax=Clostridium tarantellae TaxID=39493 RepID=A0A6I1MPT0_9CLOT|nr:ABC transporter ATP-binding protein [Clostridium tarantellae]MPQ44222.1 ATP-binding cassette domain-containing protein [Clostridium tarantellae]